MSKSRIKGYYNLKKDFHRYQFFINLIFLIICTATTILVDAYDYLPVIVPMYILVQIIYSICVYITNKKSKKSFIEFIRMEDDGLKIALRDKHNQSYAVTVPDFMCFQVEDIILIKVIGLKDKVYSFKLLNADEVFEVLKNHEKEIRLSKEKEEFKELIKNTI